MDAPSTLVRRAASCARHRHPCAFGEAQLFVKDRGRRPVPRDGVLRLCRGAPLRGAFRCCLCDPLFLGPMNYAVAGAQEAAQHQSSTLPARRCGGQEAHLVPLGVQWKDGQ
jgi:hypothetical protein